MVHIVVVDIKSPFNKQYTCSTIIETHNYCNRNSNSSTVQVVQYSTVYCTALYIIVLHCAVLYCTIYYTVQYCTALWYVLLIALYWTV